MTHHPHHLEEMDALNARADRFDGFDRGDLDNSHAYDNEEPAVHRGAASELYCADLTEQELTEGDGRTVLDDRDRLLDALKAIQANPNDPRAHRVALDALAGR